MSSSCALTTAKGVTKTTSFHLKPTMHQSLQNYETKDTDSTDDDTKVSKEQQSKKKTSIRVLY
jgi:hypothetical protein